MADVMSIIQCPYCGVKVLLRSDGRCPNCGELTAEVTADTSLVRSQSTGPSPAAQELAGAGSMPSEPSGGKQFGMTRRRVEMVNKITNILFMIIAVLLALFFTFFQKTDKEFSILGPRYLRCNDNIMRLVLNRSFKSLEFRFTDPVRLSRGKITKYENGQSISSDVKPIGDRIIYISIDRDTSTTNQRARIELIFSEYKKGNVPRRRQIREVLVNSNRISSYDFLSNYVAENSSNIELYKPFHFANVSNYLAEKYGNALLSVIKVFLLILLITQILILFYTFIESFISKESIIIEGHPVPFIRYIDMISKDYAVILGFLGTVVSIWVALEISGHDYSNFLQILDIIKTAIFTTVEGLVIVTVYSIRELVFNIESSNDGNEK